MPAPSRFRGRSCRMACANTGCARRRPSARLRMRPGSETLYARVIEPAEPAAGPTLIFGSGLCLEFELLAVAHDPGRRLAAWAGG